MNPDAADALVDSPSAYVHIPFCARVCPYCDFAVVAGQDDEAERYIDAVVSEITNSEQWRRLDSVFFGGGTPSHIDHALLGMVLDALAERHGIADGAEITLEANPEDFSAVKAAEIRLFGFNRVSFGAQSFDEGVLAALGRRHQPHDIVAAVDAGRRGGLDNLSVDLIYGSTVESSESWSHTVEQALALEIDHVSCYALTVEPGTPLGRSVAAGTAAPDPDTQADRFEHADTMIAMAGMERYEVSNWARPGFECRYNSTVWAQGEYLAFGNGAHGFTEGVRFRNLRRLEAYMGAVESGKSPRAGTEPIQGWASEVDRLFVGLRRTVGVAHGPGTHALMASAEGVRLMEAGVICDTGDRLVVRLPLLTDAVQRAVLGLAEPNTETGALLVQVPST